jgi:cellulose biosynthesis protein BcsQ
MAIISFWNELEKENGQTTSIIALATQMAIEHNYRILVVDATFDDKTLEKAFWKPRENKMIKELNAGKIDISSGAEGLISAVASNKATPEIITNYTRVVFKNRLDILLGLKTKIPEEHEKSLMLYKDLIATANRYYDLVFVDLTKSYRKPSTKSILNISNVIAYVMPPNLFNIDNFKEKSKKDPIMSSNKILPILAKSDETSGYNVKNTSRYMGQKKYIASIPYNVRFMEATNEAKAAEFFTKFKLSSSSINEGFFEEVERSCTIIISKLKELNL